MTRFLFFFLFLTSLLKAQQSLQFLKVLDEKSGLSGTTVNVLLKDKRGFLWIGTENGLNRYDGSEIKTYLHKNADPYSLPNDFIVGLLEDKAGFIWVGTLGGIARFNPTNGLCENFTNQNGLLRGGDYLNKAFFDRDGHLWTSNHGGLYAFVPKERKFLRHPASDSLSVFNVAVDKDNIFWVGGAYGLQRFDPQSGDIKRFFHYTHIDPNNRSLSAVNVKIDSFSNIWVMSWGGGLYRFHPETLQFEQFKWVINPEFPEYFNIPFDIAESFDEKKERTFWIATENGVIQMPLDFSRSPSIDAPFTYFRDYGGQPKALLVEGNNLWAAGAGGLYKVTLLQSRFKKGASCTSGIKNFSLTSHGDILISSTKPALTISDTSGRIKYVYEALPEHQEDLKSYRSDQAVEDIESGLIYTGTYSGMFAIDPVKHTTRWFQHHLTDTTELSSSRVALLLPLGNGRVLITYWVDEPQLFDARTGKNIRKLWHEKIICRGLRRDTRGVVWVCAEYKLLVFDTIDQVLKVVLEPPADEQVVFVDVLSDRKGRYWTATENGLWQFDPATRRIITRYDKNAGLPGSIIGRIAEDRLGRIWMSTSKGICIFNPETLIFYTLTLQDGLINQGNINNLSVSSDKKFWFSQNKELYYFDPESIVAIPPSKCYITGLRINERDSLFSIPFEQIRKVVLSPGENALTFSYTAIDLESPGRTHFIYQLDGLQKEWFKAGNNRRASFVNLPAGTYTFRVRPEDAGENNTWDAILCVVVTDYFWQRTWFKILAVIILTSVITALFFISRTRQLRLNTERLKAEKEIETAQKNANRSTLAALRAFINPHFLFNALNAVQASILRKAPAEASAALGKFADLMRRTLEQAQKETVPLAEELELLQLYLESQQLRFENAFEFHIDIGEEVDTDEDFLPTMILQPFVENAIEHGLLLKKDGKGFLKIKIEKAGELLCCIVEDNGVGRIRAAEIAAGKLNRKTSQGTRITEERLRLLSEKNRVEIVDLYTEDGRACGTKVRVWVGG